MSNQNNASVIVRNQDATAIVALNNAKCGNLFSEQMQFELTCILQQLMHEDAVRVIVLTGIGDDFCAGDDLAHVAQLIDPILLRDKAQARARLARVIWTGSKPVIAAVEGCAIGTGMALTALSDIAIGARNAVFSCTHLDTGLVPDAGLLWTLPQKIGAGKARQLMLTGEHIYGEEACRLGLLNTVCEPGKALECALDEAQRLARLPPVTLMLLKGALVNAMNSVDAAVRHEVDLNPLARTTHDHKEAVMAFMEKRKPQFRGE